MGVVASNKIGAAPFLVKHKKNGMLFQSGSIKSLYKAVKFIIENNSLRKQFAVEAYNTIKNEWSPQIAAVNFIKLVDSLQRDESDILINEGPCSRAHIINSKKLLK